MKKIISILFFALSVFAGSPPGTNVGGMVAPTDSNDVYATHNALWGKGGYRSVYDTAARNAIPVLRRDTGMAVFCYKDSTNWRLGGGISNSNWKNIDTCTATKGFLHGVAPLYLVLSKSATQLKAAPVTVDTTTNLVTFLADQRINGNLSVGIAANPIYKSYFYQALENTGSWAVVAQNVATTSTNGSYNSGGMSFSAYNTGTANNTGYLAGIQYFAVNSASSGTLSQLFGSQNLFGNLSGNPTTQNAYGYYTRLLKYSGSIVNAIGLYIDTPLGDSTATNQWTIYSPWTANSFLAGGLRVMDTVRASGMLKADIGIINDGDYLSINNIRLGDTSGTTAPDGGRYLGGIGTYTDENTDSQAIYVTAAGQFDTTRGAGIMMLGNENGGTMSMMSGSKGNTYISGTDIYFNVFDTVGATDISEIKISENDVYSDHNVIDIRPCKNDSAIIRISGASPNPSGSTVASVEINRGNINIIGDTVNIDNLHPDIIKNCLSAEIDTTRTSALYVDGVRILPNISGVASYFTDTLVWFSMSNFDSTKIRGDINLSPLSIEEVGGTAPGIWVELVARGVTSFKRVALKALYYGSTSHMVRVGLKYYSKSKFEKFTTIRHLGVNDTTRSTGPIEDYSFSVDSCEHYISGDSVVIQFYHDAIGNSSHRLFIQELTLRN
jgi:hypothetical protein